MQTIKFYTYIHHKIHNRPIFMLKPKFKPLKTPLPQKKLSTAHLAPSVGIDAPVCLVHCRSASSRWHSSCLWSGSCYSRHVKNLDW